MSRPAPALYTASEVAAALRCSLWWVKEQARQRRIPYCWIGGSYRFTAEHLAEIVRMLEVRPIRPATPAEPLASSVSAVRRSNGRSPVESADRLRARPPRRVRVLGASGDVADAA